jgi:purine-binding chemotaxis protein CheW
MSEPVRRVDALLVEQRLALSCYLEALLTEQPMYLPVPVRPVEPVAPIEIVARVIEPVAVAAPLDNAIDVESPVAVAPAVATSQASVVTPVGTSAADAAALHAPVAADIPEWASAPFQSLLLKVQGLTLALPLVKLNRILPWTEPTHLPGYLPWLLGVVRHLDRNVRVVDTAALVMPERAPARDAAAAADGRHIVLIGDGRWGLVCDDVSTVLEIDPAQVRWRSSRTKRPWLAGTVVEHLCALLDAEQLAALLEQGCPELTG